VAEASSGEAVPAGRPLPIGPGSQTSFTPNYRTYVLVILTLVYVLNYLDRQLLGILLPDIQAEFSLSDTYGGFLSGTVFAFIYATLGIPVAILADRVSRRNIIAMSVAMFSLMTVLSGFVVQFWQLVLTRFGTGVGEAGTGPSINSVIADLYPPEKRASALAFYSAGLNVGLLVAFFGGGLIAQHYGWRVAFITAGIPGIVLVLLLMFTVSEPARGAVERLADDTAPPSIWAVCAHLWSQKSFCWIAIGTAMSAFGGYAGIFFIPKFLIVSHHLTKPQVGLMLALLVGVAGAIGTYLAGVFADHFGKSDVRRIMYVPIWATFIAVPFGPLFYLPANTAVALCAAIVPALMGATYLGPSFSMTQSLVPLRMRAQSIAILLFVLNAIALGLGPLTVGFLSDALNHGFRLGFATVMGSHPGFLWIASLPAVGADSLRYSLLCVSVATSLMGAFCYWRATKTLKSDLARGSFTAAKS
jgi:predicted MFS family arabinose efflux permease